MHNLDHLRQIALGRAEIRIGLIDGPVASALQAFASSRLEAVGSPNGATWCDDARSAACVHGTFVAGILCAARDSGAPAICPGCTVLVRPIFYARRSSIEGADPRDLARAIRETVQAGARLINLSAAAPPLSAAPELRDALDLAARRGVIVVAAAGNQGSVTSSPLTRHPAVLPIAACDRVGRPWPGSNLGLSIGRSGWSACGERVVSLSPDGRLHARSGTSAATPLVTGALALLWSERPELTSAELRYRVRRAAPAQGSIVPPVFDAAAAHRALEH
jgi:subtilisin family serine protease